MTPRTKAYIFLLLSSIIWGLAGVVIKMTLVEVEPFIFLAYRFLISAVVSIFTWKTVKITIPKSPITSLWLVLYTLLSTTLALGFLFAGMETSSVLSLSLISIVTPLLVIAAGALFLKEKVTHKEKIGVAIALFGTIFTVIEPILASNGHQGELRGNLLLLGYLITDVASVIFLKKLLKKDVHPWLIINISFLIGFITILPVTLFFHTPEQIILRITTLPIPYHLGVWYMALFSGTIAYFFRAKAQKTIEVGEAGLFGYLVSIFSAPLAVILLNEKITPLFVFGAVIVIIGVIIAENKRRFNKR